MTNEHLLRFTNPDGPETIDIPLDNLKEVVVVRPKDDEIGEVAELPVAGGRHSTSTSPPFVDSRTDSGRRRLLGSRGGFMARWARSAITTYTQMGEFNLSGY